MANHKSALKRNRQAHLARVRNKSNRTRVKNVIRTVDEAIGEQSVEMAQAALKLAIPVIQSASTKGAFHKKNASRKVSRLTKRVNALAASA